MINPISEQKAQSLQKRLSLPMERFDLFPEPTDYYLWIKKIVEFIGSQSGALEIGIEKYKGELEFFVADGGEEYVMMFMSSLTPQEFVFFGSDWIIGVSSYPECEGSTTLEYGIRLYGTASVVKKPDGPAKSASA